MKNNGLSVKLWGKQAKISYLLLAASVLLFSWLGGRELWTQEHRWAEIVAGMFEREDFFHPYLGQASYYDKPLLSYWLMAGIAKLTGSVSTWALRLPSVLSGLLALASIYMLGNHLKGRQFGLLAAWLLLTTYYFAFWARTSSADMLNLAGSLLAVTWYFLRRDRAGLLDYAVFFMIVALTSLCKGLVGAAVPAIAVAVDVCLRGSWRRYVSVSFLLSMLPALLIYAAPFIASSWTNTSYDENGLYLVYRENILRYFKPFDHQGPLYTYLIYLPVYLLPWTIFFIPALFSLPKRWRDMTVESRWMVYTVAALFLFFTSSGSRRSYYVLPMVPFAILMTADWLMSASSLANNCLRWSAKMIGPLLLLILLVTGFLPTWYNTHYGVARFAAVLEKEASLIRPWQDWNIVMVDADSKLNFYLGLQPDHENKTVPRDRTEVSTALFQAKWPELLSHQTSTIFVTRQIYVPYLAPLLTNYRKVSVSDASPHFLKNYEKDEAVAFIPIYSE